MDYNLMSNNELDNRINELREELKQYRDILAEAFKNTILVVEEYEKIKKVREKRNGRQHTDKDLQGRDNIG